MSTKITVKVEKEVLKMASEFAMDKGLNLSEMIENYIKSIAISGHKIKPETLSPRIQRLRGIIKLDAKQDYKEILVAELTEKYGL